MNLCLDVKGGYSCWCPPSVAEEPYFGDGVLSVTVERKKNEDKSEQKTEEEPEPEPKTWPIDIVVVVDESGSMLPHMEKMRMLLNFFCTKLHDNVRMALVGFSDKAEVYSSLEPVDSTKINKLCAKNMTNLFDGLDTAKKLLLKSGRPGSQKVVFVVTDGVANVGITSKDQMLSALVSNCPRIFSVAIGSDCNLDLLYALALQSEGDCFLVQNAMDIPKACGAALGSLLNPGVENLVLTFPAGFRNVSGFSEMYHEISGKTDVVVGKVAEAQTVHVPFEFRVTLEPLSGVFRAKATVMDSLQHLTLTDSVRFEVQLSSSLGEESGLVRVEHLRLKVARAVIDNDEERLASVLNQLEILHGDARYEPYQELLDFLRERVERSLNGKKELSDLTRLELLRQRSQDFQDPGLPRLVRELSQSAYDFCDVSDGSDLENDDGIFITNFSRT